MISFLDLQCAGRDRSGSHDLNCKLQWLFLGFGVVDVWA